MSLAMWFVRISGDCFCRKVYGSHSGAVGVYKFSPTRCLAAIGGAGFFAPAALMTGPKLTRDTHGAKGYAQRMSWTSFGSSSLRKREYRKLSERRRLPRSPRVGLLFWLCSL
jgi:hypothetical protein